MAERLKQIWAGFAETTSRHLTGKGVDNIIVPHRSDYTVDDSGFLPDRLYCSCRDSVRRSAS